MWLRRDIVNEFEFAQRSFRALIQGTTTLVRAHSGIFTAGIANPIVATAELGGAIVMSLVSLAAPFIAIALLVLFCLIVFLVRRTKQSRPSGSTH